MIKPGEIIGIDGVEGWTLADRRVWNLLLANAWSDRLEDPAAEFNIPLAELRGLHKGNERIRETLDKLQTTLVSARLPNGKMRKVQMLGGTDLDDDERTAGTLEYGFDRKLVPLLRDSEIYARMEVKVLSAFTSKILGEPLRGLGGSHQPAQVSGGGRNRHLAPLARCASRQTGPLGRF